MTNSLQNETFIVADDYMKFCIGISGTPPSESAKAMRCLAKEVENSQGSVMRPLMQSFLIACGAEPWTGLRSIMLELAGDGRLNWGRVISLFAFTGMLASELCSRGEDVSCSRRLAEMIVDFLNGDKQEWLIQNGGWGRLTNFAHAARRTDQDSSMRTALYAAAGVGIAGITFLLAR
ncbi:anti-apoptotic protein NR13-like [Brienomyrus brachyistius]|uniref:anti-apoptotic protein NR13-like n=1 Tax=Brienomyrus brachyistius TaxID=42636 RepID=UPI0020B2EE73|nr:anti-apoptotic protein NR13-like [Brienomyrus brachyistius]